jgi:CBS domain-containing protein
MKVQDVLSTSTPALHTDDTVEHAYGLLMEHRVRHLPVLDEGDHLAGVISETQLMDAPSAEAEVGHLVRARPVSIHPEAHIFDAARIMVEHDLTTLPVTREGMEYVGVLKRHDIFDRFAQMLATQESGAILALEVDPRDYALAKLIHTIEQNGAKVLAVASESPDETSDKIRVTLKLNVTDITRVRHVIEHHGYRIVASFSEDDEEMLERAQAFMRYLEV